MKYIYVLLFLMLLFEYRRCVWDVLYVLGKHIHMGICVIGAPCCKATGSWGHGGFVFFLLY